MIKTRKSDPNKPFRMLIYGQEGTGKSTFGALAPKPIFISAEGGTDQLTTRDGGPVEEMPDVDKWPSVLHALKTLETEKHDFETVVLDSADWLEGLAHKEIIGASKKTITTVDGGYGSGYRKTQNFFQELVESLSNLRDKKKMNVIFLAHSHVKPVKDPEMPHDYDQFEIKLHEMPSAVIREWVDLVGFVRFETTVKSSDETDKARAHGTGDRIIYLEKRPSFQAKNRYGMPSDMPFTLEVWEEMMPYIRKGPIAAEAKPPVDLKAQIEETKTKVADKELLKKVQVTIDAAGDDPKKLAAILSRLQTLTKTKGEA